MREPARTGGQLADLLNELGRFDGDVEILQARRDGVAPVDAATQGAPGTGGF